MWAGLLRGGSLAGGGRELGAVGDAELAVDVGEVGLDGLAAHQQVFASIQPVAELASRDPGASVLPNPPARLEALGPCGNTYYLSGQRALYARRDGPPLRALCPLTWDCGR